MIAKFRKKFVDDIPRDLKPEPRHIDATSISYAAGRLAIEWGILPFKKGQLMSACQTILAQTSDSLYPSVREVAELLNANKTRILKKDNVDSFNHNSHIGVRQTKGKSVLICLPKSEFKALYGKDTKSVLMLLKAAGILQCDGRHLTRKAPTFSPFQGRVLHFLFSLETLKSVAGKA